MSYIATGAGPLLPSRPSASILPGASKGESSVDSDMAARGYVWVSSPPPGHWERKKATGGPTVTVTNTPPSDDRVACNRLGGQQRTDCLAVIGAGGTYDDYLTLLKQTSANTIIAGGATGGQVVATGGRKTWLYVLLAGGAVAAFYFLRPKRK